jgi:methylmalonyl-CoA mutase N-terminal domain/subunit
LERIRAERDNAEVRRTLDRVLADAREERNVLPALMEAVKAYATVGELTHCLVEAYGRYEEPIRF